MAIGKSLRPKKEKFLKAFAKFGTITKSAKIAGCSRQAHAVWLRDDPEYPERFEQAKKESCDNIDEEIRRRAFKGSDTLLIFLAKGAMPDKYKDRGQYDHSNSGNFKIQITDDAGWFGNNAHDDSAKGPSPPAPGDSLPGTDEAPSLRETLGEDGSGPDVLP